MPRKELTVTQLKENAMNTSASKRARKDAEKTLAEMGDEGLATLAEIANETSYRSQRKRVNRLLREKGTE